MIDITTLFCSIDDFYIEFEPKWNKMLLHSDKRKPRRTPSLSKSDVMTIVVFFHISGYRKNIFLYVLATIDFLNLRKQSFSLYIVIS